MNFSNPNIKDYLSGKLFSNIYEFKLDSNRTELPKRIDLLKKLVAGKKIIHFGCCDHINIIKEKIESNGWLHKIFTEITLRCEGLDNNLDAVMYCHGLGFSNITCTNIISDPFIENIKNENWDFIVLGEVLEHVDNPVDLLSNISNKYGDCIKHIIITVPNAFSHVNSRFFKRGIERINSDHRYWFTPYTLSKVMSCSGISIESIYFADSSFLSFFELLVRKIKRVFRIGHQYNISKADTLICIGTFNIK